MRLFVKLAQIRRDLTKGRHLANEAAKPREVSTAAFRISENAPGEFAAS